MFIFFQTLNELTAFIFCFQQLLQKILCNGMLTLLYVKAQRKEINQYRGNAHLNHGAYVAIKTTKARQN